tara:strand:+ start:488 stop:694 length:207 start_codon:yes stop_codon:yes gene_type:complete
MADMFVSVVTATTAEIGATLVDGTIELELDELIPVAKELVAVTVKVYVVPFSNPSKEADVLVDDMYIL